MSTAIAYKHLVVASFTAYKVAKCQSLSSVLILENKKKSSGAKSGLYGGSMRFAKYSLTITIGILRLVITMEMPNVANFFSEMFDSSFKPSQEFQAKLCRHSLSLCHKLQVDKAFIVEKID